jgi:hypothetical protein
MKVAVFCYVTTCSFIGSYQCLAEHWNTGNCLADYTDLIPQDSNCNDYRRDNLISLKDSYSYEARSQIFLHGDTIFVLRIGSMKIISNAVSSI